jgi:hypothetical protein
VVLGLLPVQATAQVSQGDTDALVFEFEDRWTGATGAARLLEEAGFNVAIPDPSKPLSAEGIELIVFGSFSSEHPQYDAFTERNRETILEFVEAGGVLLHMTQADQTESVPAILPPGTRISRGDTDLSVLYLVSGGHPLLDELPIETGKVAQLNLPIHLGRPPNWESFHQANGLRVLLSSDLGLEHPALLEAAHGAGRMVYASLFLDKIYKNGERVGPEPLQEAAERFFGNLHRYVGLVRAGKAPQVEPTEPPPPIEPLPWVPGSWTLAVLPDTQVYSMRYPELFEKQTRWIKRNVEERNIAYVLHLGDIVNNNNAEQWRRAEKAMRILDGAIPYAIRKPEGSALRIPIYGM